MHIKFFLVLIFSLALLLRVFHLGDYPKTLYGDEQAFAWNAYSVLMYGEDEYGTHLPLQFRSFDDYKAPIPVYLLVPFIKIFGLSAIGVRLPIAFASTLLVVLTYFLSRLFFKPKISLLASFLTAISPWLLHLSRGYFEATLALLFFVAGIYFVLRSKASIKGNLVGMTFFVMSIYSYFTPRILLPLFLPFLFCYVLFSTKNENKTKIAKVLVMNFIYLFILTLPLLYATVFGKGFSRFDKLSGDTDKIVIQTVNKERTASNLPPAWSKTFHNKATVWTRFIFDNYLEHLSINFWYIYGDNSLRYFLGNMGMFYLFELPFLVVGLYSLWRENRKAFVLLMGWILIAPIPASVVGRSFAVRSLAMLPAPFLIVGYGMYKAVETIKKIPLIYLTSFTLNIIVVFSVSLVLIRYYLEYPVYAATWWGWENKAALDFAKERENQFDNIFISDFYTGAPLAFAVYNAYDPREFRKAVENPVFLNDNRKFIKLGKYHFGSLDINKKRFSENVIPPRSLYIGRPEELESDEKIVAPDDGRVLFRIYETN